MDQAQAFDEVLFRRVMGRFATGVTVVAAYAAGGLRAMTANAFLSASLDPPLCLVSVGRAARMHRHLLAAERFSVNVLARDQEAVSNLFAGRGGGDASAVPFDPLHGVPLLPGAVARLAAVKVAVHDCGDHSLFVGRILHMDRRPGEPLVYLDGRYGSFDHEAETPAVPPPDQW